MKGQIKVAPSILAADFAHLANEVKRCENAKADAIHVDIMDGHFVNNISMGPHILEAVSRSRSNEIFLDVHLMIYNPFNYIEDFVKAGANSITFHVEATEDVDDTINFIKKCGIKAGIALNPETSFSLAEKYIKEVDLVLLMTVNPGFGGQKFIENVLDKIEIAKKFKDEGNLTFDIQVDGGINDETAKKCKKVGANNLVAGTYLFSQKDMKIGIDKLRV